MDTIDKFINTTNCDGAGSCYSNNEFSGRTTTGYGCDAFEADSGRGRDLSNGRWLNNGDGSGATYGGKVHRYYGVVGRGYFKTINVNGKHR